MDTLTPLDVLKDLVQHARVAIPGTAYFDALKRARAYLAEDRCAQGHSASEFTETCTACVRRALNAYYSTEETRECTNPGCLHTPEDGCPAR